MFKYIQLVEDSVLHHDDEFLLDNLNTALKEAIYFMCINKSQVVPRAMQL